MRGQRLGGCCGAGLSSICCPLGRFNVGGHPRDAVAKIEDVLEIRDDREEYLGGCVGTPAGKWGH